MHARHFIVNWTPSAAHIREGDRSRERCWEGTRRRHVWYLIHCYKENTQKKWWTLSTVFSTWRTHSHAPYRQYESVRLAVQSKDRWYSPHNVTPAIFRSWTDLHMPCTTVCFFTSHRIRYKSLRFAYATQDAGFPSLLSKPLRSPLSGVWRSYSMVQSPSWEANWFAASQEVPCILWNPKVHCRTHKHPWIDTAVHSEFVKIRVVCVCDVIRSLIDRYPCFRGTYCLHFHDRYLPPWRWNMILSTKLHGITR